MSHKGRSDAGATLPHGRAGLTPKLKKLFCQVGRRRRPNREADFSVSVPASQKNMSEANTLI